MQYWSQHLYNLLFYIQWLKIILYYQVYILNIYVYFKYKNTTIAVINSIIFEFSNQDKPSVKNIISRSYIPCTLSNFLQNGKFT